MTAISEISRVMCKDSYLVIEYERSLTGELFLSLDMAKNIVKLKFMIIMVSITIIYGYIQTII